MPAIDDQIGVGLPKDWPRCVRSGAIHAISLARFSLTVARGHAANNWNARIRLQEENDRLRHEVVLLREELRIKDARMERIRRSAGRTTLQSNASPFSSFERHAAGRSPRPPGTCSCRP